MKPFKEEINYPTENSFVLRYTNFDHFTVPWHFHNEFEMAFIVNSTGKRFVGDTIENFGPGDFAFYGSTLPHFHHSDEQYYFGDPRLRVNAYILQFPVDYFTENQLRCPEFSGIQRLLSNSSRGLKFPDHTREPVAKMLHEMYAQKGLKRYLNLIELLNYLGYTDFSPIASRSFANTITTEVDNRMAKVYEFSTQSYNRKISINEVASVAGMNTAAFCRYFRKKTGKTFAEFVNELRISYACKLLRHGGNRTVEFICFEAGFNNLSNFNRQFKARVGKSPSEYRKLINNQGE
jgi:AraC-like DNA-binding protein